MVFLLVPYNDHLRKTPMAMAPGGKAAAYDFSSHGILRLLMAHLRSFME